jgi:hypothetical protein
MLGQTGAELHTEFMAENWTGEMKNATETRGIFYVMHQLE